MLYTHFLNIETWNVSCTIESMSCNSQVNTLFLLLSTIFQMVQHTLVWAWRAIETLLLPLSEIHLIIHNTLHKTTCLDISGLQNSSAYYVWYIIVLDHLNIILFYSLHQLCYQILWFSYLIPTSKGLTTSTVQHFKLFHPNTSWIIFVSGELDQW